MLNDESMVREYFNVSFDAIWNEFIWITLNPPFMIMKCATASLPLSHVYSPDQIAVKESLQCF